MPDTVRKVVKFSDKIKVREYDISLEKEKTLDIIFNEGKPILSKPAVKAKVELPITAHPDLPVCKFTELRISWLEESLGIDTESREQEIDSNTTFSPFSS